MDRLGHVNCTLFLLFLLAAWGMVTSSVVDAEATVTEDSV